MVKRCSFDGCQSTSGLHAFPSDPAKARQWLGASGLPLSSNTAAMFICNLHFSPESYSNSRQVELGFISVHKLRLSSTAVPNRPCPTTQTRVFTEVSCQTESVPVMKDVACQTCPVALQHTAVQANVKPARRSKATQSKCKMTSVACETTSLDAPLATSTPVKRPRHDEVCAESDDLSFHPDSTFEGERTSMETESHKMKKFIVYEENLMKLFKRCPVCTRSCVLSTRTVGSLLHVDQRCPHCEHSLQWDSQPSVNRIPAGNLQLAAAVLFTGSSFLKVSEFMKAFHLQGIGQSTYHKHQRNLLLPTINWQWNQEQAELIQQAVGSGEVILGGDMRADTPGFCAKMGSYSMMDLKSNKILDIQLVQSNEVGNSLRMEKEGFERSLKFLEGKGVVITSIVTDRHTGVQKLLRETRPHIDHRFDPWHIGKGLGKKIDALAKVRMCGEVSAWKKSVVNHLYWSGSTSSSGEETVAKWKSVANHIQDIHSHDTDIFPHCMHQPLVGDQARQWLLPSTPACERLVALLLNPRLIKDMEKISCTYQTSTIEAFHSLILKFAPKRVAFSFLGMLCRLQLSAMHYNNNSERLHARTKEGTLRYAILYPKYKHGDYTVRPLKDSAMCGYVDNLLDLLFEHVVGQPDAYQQQLEQIPVPESLCAQFDRPDKGEAVERHQSRFMLPN